MVQQSEVVSLTLAIIFLLSVAYLHRERRLPRLPLIYAAVGAMACANLFTVVEGLFWEPVFNFLEHLCYALSGLLFAAGCWLLPSRLAQKGGRPW